MKPTFRKLDPLQARTQAPPATARVFCGKCGRPGDLKCAACAAAERAWVRRNCEFNGGAVAEESV